MTAIRIDPDRGVITIGRRSFPAMTDPTGALVVAGCRVRAISLAERNQLVGLAEEPDRGRQLAAFVGTAAADCYDEAEVASTATGAVAPDGTEAVIQAVALHLAGASRAGSLARTTLLVSRALGDAAGSVPAAEADRLAESMAAALDRATPVASVAADEGWTILVYEPRSADPTTAPEDPGDVRDVLAALLLAREAEPLDRSLAEALLADDPRLTAGDQGSRTLDSTTSAAPVPAPRDEPLAVQDEAEPGRWGPAPTVETPATADRRRPTPGPPDPLGATPPLDARLLTSDGQLSGPGDGTGTAPDRWHRPLTPSTRAEAWPSTPGKSVPHRTAASVRPGISRPGGLEPGEAGPEVPVPAAGGTSSPAPPAVGPASRGPVSLFPASTAPATTAPAWASASSVAPWPGRLGPDTPPLWPSPPEAPTRPPEPAAALRGNCNGNGNGNETDWRGITTPAVAALDLATIATELHRAADRRGVRR